MEFDDSFTEKLIQRTQARREYIKKKRGTNVQTTSIKRPALVEEQQIPGEDDGSICDSFEESPKRQCLEDVSADCSSVEDDKENSFCQEKEPLSFVPVQSNGPTRGLAALKKKNDGQSETASTVISNQEEPQVNKCPTYMFSTNTSELFSDRKSRFANLAAHIKQWDDDSFTTSEKPNKVTLATNKPPSHKTSMLSNVSNFSKSYASNSLSSNLHNNNSSSFTNNNLSKNISKHVTFEEGNVKSKGDLGSVPPCMPSVSKGNVVANKIKALSNAQKQTKVRDVWDEAVMAALETEMIANSPSKHQLEIPESIEENSDNENDIEMEDAQPTNFEESSNEPCSMERIKSASVSDYKPNLLKQNQNQTGSNFQSRPSVGSISQNTDPAELPLSARKALFERAFFGESPKVNDDVFEPKLSVAQRAAMFEKASKTKIGSPKKTSVSCNRFTSPAASPVKFMTPGPVNVKSPMKNVTVSPKPKTISSSVEFKGSPIKQSPAIDSTPSPSKNIGSHTRLVQQQLIENANTNWQQNEIVSKSADQRKTELSNLVNHWEKMSSSSSNSGSANSGGLSHYDLQSSNETYEPVFQNSHENAEPCSESEEEYDEDSEISKNENDEERIDRDYETADIKNQNELAKKQLNYGEMQSDDLKSAVSVCDELDEILDDSLSQNQEQRQTEKTFAFPEPLKSNSCSSNESNGSTLKEKPACFTQVTPGSSQGESNPDVPLLYTISFYRKQKQEGRTTPVRTVVRREHVMSPPSPEVDKTALIQERIQALQEEILRQQTVISQTSQALNLCHATAEFSGSIEQVEGERLLLIATQKRQACLNEVQRLKTQASQNEFITDGTGTLTISDIQLLLKPEFMASELQGKSSDIVHYFLCLFRYGPQVIVSQMLSTNDPVSDGALCFTNHIKIQNLTADFSVVFEVYALQTKKDNLSHEKKYHIRREHSKIRLTPKGKRAESKILLPAICSPGGPNAVRTPSFGVVGYTRFTIQNFSKKVFTLDKVPFVSPLNGVLKAKIRLHAEHVVVEKGFLTMFEDVSGFGAWHRRWCVLDGPSLSYWKYPDDEKKKEPIGVFDLKQCVTGQIRLVSRDVCARAHTLEIVTVRPQAKGDRNTLISRSVNTLTTTQHLVSADTKEERILWCNKLNEALANLRKWDPTALRPIEVKFNK